MNLISQYRNGNYNVSLFDDGTKIRENDLDVLVPEFPENMDIKITNFCDNVGNPNSPNFQNSSCMAHCHERSNPHGKHGNLELGLNLLKSWNPGCECAFGGGSTLSHPDIIPFLKGVKELGLISNITVNSFHFNTQTNLILDMLKQDLVKGIGCSYIKGNPLDRIKEVSNNSNNNLVFHLIIGIHTLDDIKIILDNFEKPKILLLGYKIFGNGINYYNKLKQQIDKNLFEWYSKLYTLFDIKNLVVSFDNLSIVQLNVKRFFTTKNWNEFYQGDDGFASMYIDLVKEEYGLSSRSEKRFKLNQNDTIKRIFNQIKK